MRAYLLNKSVQFKSNCRFSAKKLPLPPGRCQKDFFIFFFICKKISYYFECRKKNKRLVGTDNL